MDKDNELSQMGSAKVRLIERQGQRCIHKQGANEVERAFYLTAAKTLSERECCHLVLSKLTLIPSL